MICLKPYKDKESGEEYPCGRCMPCRINRVREWTIRMLHEYESFHGKALFITLTYAPEYLPENATLVKSDLQKFFKRLRKNLHGRFIKYFACGEYGTKGRPHYHAIVFGIDRKDVPILKKCWPYQSEFLWRKGKSYDDVNRDTCSYVAGYVQKKLYGKIPSAVYTESGRIPPFQLQSQKIGYQYFIKNFDRFMTLHGAPYRGKIAPLPRYYKKKINTLKAFPKQLYEPLNMVYQSNAYKRKITRAREGWKLGYRHGRLTEFIYQSEMTAFNIQRRFDNSKIYWRNKVE